MARFDRIILLAALVVIAACASTGTPAYWTSLQGRGAADFALDNERCGAAATRVAPTPRADQLPGGIVAPDNRMDRPPQHWANGVADHAYMDCMAGQGWRVARR